MRWRSSVRFVIRWIALVVAGWLTYGLLRGLSAIVWLGVPPFDWAWYAAAIPLLTALPLCLVWRPTSGRPAVSRRRRLLPYLAIGLLSGVVIASYNGFGQEIKLDLRCSRSMRVSFWSGLDFTRVPEAVLEDIRAAGGYIYFGAGGYYPLEGSRGQELAASIRRLADYGIEVYIATPAGNDFLSAPVASDWIRSTRSALDFARREGLTNVRGVIGDAEPPLHSPSDLTGIHRAQFDQAVKDMRDLIDGAHREHPDRRIGVTATWGQYVDALDGDSDLALIMRSPVNPPGGWDFVNLMTYSSYFPSDWRPYSVYLLESGMARLHPERPISHLIGLVGSAMPGEPLLDPEDLVRDARLSRALGVREIVVFHLDGALPVFGEDFVRRFVAAVESPASGAALRVPFSRPASLLFYGLPVADALLDARGSQGWLWLGWIVASGLITMRMSFVPLWLRGY